MPPWSFRHPAQYVIIRNKARIKFFQKIFKVGRKRARLRIARKEECRLVQVRNRNLNFNDYRYYW